MSTSQQIENALKQVHDQKSFFQDLLATTLEWPLADAQQVDDIAYGWSQSDLNAAGLERSLVEGSIWQIQPSAAGQPWGVFVLQFKDESSLSPRRGLAGVLRKVLKGLVGSRRKDARLPSWKREHLLFICTHDWKSFRFAYYRSKPDEPRSAKLTTFGWSPDTSNRTVVEFNLPALVWPENPTDAQSWVSAWAKAFDKEPLTNDFFRRFDKALEAIKADLESYQKLSSPEAYTQSQLLLERLIFLYFLQNRGWLNQEHRYLASRLAQHTDNPDGFTYYHDFLDKLFWTLSTAPSGAGRLPGVPFLNGGLFDDDEFRQSLRKSTPPLRVRNRSMKFVFQELLEAFNFTVTEDTPLHQEVAVDPEMLGKVFESIILRAEAADPDAIAPDKRKATGSYYTPRIVVHFICQEVLYQYLLSHLPGNSWEPQLKALFSIDPTEGIDEEGKQLLKNAISPEQAVQVRELVSPLKCCDPAVGSGAFPVGLMHELVNLRRLLETIANGYKDPVVSKGSEWLHKAKAEIVENCLFGADIQQQAIEICRLRLWLSLIVDYDLGLDPFTAEKSQFSRAIDRISQLPNLEMNFRRGDSLHDHISGVPVVILPERASRFAAQFNAISKLGAELHKAKKADRKKNLRLDILEKRLSLSRAILDEELKEIRTRDSSLDSLFGIEESNAKKRERNEREIGNLTRALAKVESDQKELEKLRRREADSQFYPKLRKLEGADFDSPFNFAWSVDFPGVFAGGKSGFDIIVGNPPFVTARNKDKSLLWRQRWPQVCSGRYHLLCPFFALSFGLLRTGGELGFIVSNGFAKRDFGEPLVEEFFPTVDLQKVIDCSGLLFPGHGTPTCLIFGAARPPRVEVPIRVTGILPGGGDLRTPPEDSVLWKSISTHHDLSDYADSRIVVRDRDREEFAKWPWSFDPTSLKTKEFIDEKPSVPLRSVLARNIGYSCVARADEIYFPPLHVLRLASIPISQIAPLTVGDELRNWTCLSQEYALFPYSASFDAIDLETFPSIERYLRPFLHHLEDRVAYGKTQIGRGLEWFEYSMLFADRIRIIPSIAFPDIVSHTHVCRFDHFRVFKDTAPIFSLAAPECSDLTIALLNSSTALFWLKQICFNKGAGESEERDRFEFMTGKVEQLPVPESLVKQLSDNSDLSRRLSELSQELTRLGGTLPSLSMRKILEMENEAFDTWNASLTGFVPRSPLLGDPFADCGSLRRILREAISTRNSICAQMIALQEEIDWCAYAAYGLLNTDHPSVNAQIDVEPIGRDQRPFKLCASGEFVYERAIALIPKAWPPDKRKLWKERVSVIFGNEHIRRIEQPVYKRRWDEQWKVGNEWRYGEIAYSAEFIDAFEWWLKEKAEWWLEHKKQSGPTELGDWSQALWKDTRIQAAWPVAAEQYAFLDYEKAREKAEDKGDPVPERPRLAADFSSFERKFKKIIEEETVPAGYPFGEDYAEMKRRLKKDIPERLKSVRGNLNVPRERFHSIAAGQYVWAGLQFREAVRRAGR